MKKGFLAAAFIAFFGLLKAQSVVIPPAVNALLQKHSCYTCHKVDKKMVGPSWTDIAAKKYTSNKFVDLVYKPVPSNWPTYKPAMLPLPKVPKADLEKMAAWVATLAK